VSLVGSVWQFESLSGWYVVVITEEHEYTFKAIVLEGPDKHAGTVQMWGRDVFRKPGVRTTRIA
jgi:hypothetical protein